MKAKIMYTTLLTLIYHFITHISHENKEESLQHLHSLRPNRELITYARWLSLPTVEPPVGWCWKLQLSDEHQRVLIRGLLIFLLILRDCYLQAWVLTGWMRGNFISCCSFCCTHESDNASFRPSRILSCPWRERFRFLHEFLSLGRNLLAD